METLDGHVASWCNAARNKRRLLLPVEPPAFFLHFAGFLSNNAYIHTKFTKAPYFRFYFRKHHLQDGMTESESFSAAVSEEILAPLLSTQKYLFTSQVRSCC